jgi:(2Fe-2S) ferredoxin
MPRPAIQILVCVNDRGPDAPKPSCAQSAGLEVYHRLKDEVKARGLRDEVLVTRTGCLKHCSRGTTVTVWPDNIWYGHVGVDDALAILDAAVEGTGPVERLLMPPGPWE